MDNAHFATQTPGALLRTYALILDELRRRELVRSSNNPVADLAEHLVAKTLGLQLVGKSSSGHDAVDAHGMRYQVKGRRITPQSSSRELGIIRKLDSGPFDYLAAVLFRADFGVSRACLIPLDVVRRMAAFSSHVNGHRFMLRENVWAEPAVIDLTEKVASVACELGCG